MPVSCFERLLQQLRELSRVDAVPDPTGCAQALCAGIFEELSYDLAVGGKELRVCVNDQEGALQKPVVVMDVRSGCVSAGGAH
jgi:hypothetical protein